MKGQVLEKVLLELLYEKSKLALVALVTGIATATVLSHKRIVASKRFTNPILASESKRVFNLITA